MKKTNNKFFATCVGLLFLISQKAYSFSSKLPEAPPAPKPPVSAPAPTPNPPISQNPDGSSYPLLWEAGNPSRKAWSDYVAKLVRTEHANKLMGGTADIENFCPRYHSLSNDQRVNFWGLLISAITKYESNFSPTSRMHETTMGVDPVTKKPVYSEGLLQLSYQDTLWAPFCQFDWSKDKSLSPTDPKKTILDPYKNLYCGLRIFANMVQKKNLIAVKSGAYWAVLIPGGKYTKVTQIMALTKKMPGCL